MSRPKIVIKSKDTPSEKKQPPKRENTEVKPLQETKPQALSPDPMPRKSWNKKLWIPLISGILILVISAAVYYFFFLDGSPNEQATNNTIDSETSYVSEIESEYEDFEKDILSRSKTIGALLNEIGVAGADISELSHKMSAQNLSNLRKGDKFTVFYKDGPELIELQPKSTPYHKFTINLTTLEVEKIAKKREVRVNQMAAIVEGNLGITFINNNLNLKLIGKLEEIFQYSVDLFKVDDGDRFKILYETEYLDGKPNEVLDITSAFIQEGNKKYYAFKRDDGRRVEYYNEFGESLKKSFLQSPIKYGGVITSGFGLRVHPKFGHTKMHLGTDYAAPEGTPIIAVADGVITGRAFAGDNGNFVKIKHDNTFETQYLHMQKFEPSVTLGTRVRQGDVIGYVGMTGLATGPHVCYRFKKDGKQVNPKEHNNSTSSRIPPGNMKSYIDKITPLQSAIKKIEYF